MVFVEHCLAALELRGVFHSLDKRVIESENPFPRPGRKRQRERKQLHKQCWRKLWGPHIRLV
jgi:hypothetical protein